MIIHNFLELSSHYARMGFYSRDCREYKGSNLPDVPMPEWMKT